MTPTDTLKEARLGCAPFLRIVMTDGQSYSAEALSPCLGTTGTAREAEARVVPTFQKQPCLSCNGESTVLIEPLDAREGYVMACEDCDGTGDAKEPYCDLCNAKLTFDYFCLACESYPDGFVERVAPLPEGWSRVAY